MQDNLGWYLVLLSDDWGDKTRYIMVATEASNYGIAEELALMTVGSYFVDVVGNWYAGKDKPSVTLQQAKDIANELLQ